MFPCKGDDRWISIAVLTDDEWNALVHAMNEPDWATAGECATAAGRVAAADTIHAQLAEWTAEREAYALMESLQAARVEAGVVQNFADLAEDPQLAARGHFVPLVHDYLDELASERSAVRLAGHPGELRRPGPKLGEHNDDVLGGILGLSSEQIADLVARDVVV